MPTFCLPPATRAYISARKQLDYWSFPTLSDGFGLTQPKAEAWRMKFCGKCLRGAAIVEYFPRLRVTRLLQQLRKGIGPLLDAVRTLRGEPIEFLFVGPIQISSIRRTCKMNAKCGGLVPTPSRVGEFYRDADVFVFPTFSDGFGLTQLEAQAWKLPI